METLLNVPTKTGYFSGAVPEGWDAKSYATFKTTNPGAEPTPQDTLKMMGAPATPTPTPALSPTLNSSNLAPQTPLSYATPNPTTTYPVGSLDTSTPTPVLPATSAEKSANSLVDQLRVLNESLVGRSAYRTEQENLAGVPEMQKTFTDLSARLKGLQNEALAIPLQLQEQAVGRGITAAGLAPIQAEQIRKNGIQALTIGALLEASKGNLTNALALADRRVEQEYGPIEEKITAAKSNLELIINSPEYTRQEKERAQLQLDIQNKRQAVVDSAKAETKAISDTAIDAAKNGADANTLRLISAAKTSKEALEISAAAGTARTKDYTFQTLTTEDEFGNKTQRIVALDPKTGQQVGTVTSSGQIVPTSVGAGATGAPTSIAGVDTSSISRFNPEQQATLIAYAQQYATTGTIPTGMPKWAQFGIISDLAKQLPKPDGAIVSSANGIKDTKIPAAEQDDLGRLYNITKYAEQLAELDKKRVGGVVSGTLGKVFGSEDQSAYIAVRKAIVDEIARMQTGAALTTEEQAFYEDYLPGRFSESFFLGQGSDKKIDNFTKLMNTKLENALANKQLSIYGYSTVKLGGEEYTVGDIIEANGVKARVNPDGTVTTLPN